jgi:Flp pilus assembly protein TadD
MNAFARAVFVGLGLIIAPAVALAAGGETSHGLLAQSAVVDLDGRPIDPLQAAPEVRATVFLFTTTDCPIANRYAPEMARLHNVFSPQGIRFWLVYVNPAESVASIRSHTRQFSYPMRALRDPRHDLVKRFGATVTPEAVVVDRGGRVQYRGRIDDRYVDFGVARPVATKRDLEEALTAVVAGRPAPNAITRAVGCIIADFRPVTFSRDIAPLVFDKCATCHRPNGPAPFSLLTYTDVRQRATQIAAVTASGFMPPWKAESDVGDFVGQKRLSQTDMALLRRWVDEGAVEGDPRERPAPPRFVDGWQLGAPDLVVSIPTAYTLQAEASDVFRIFVIRLPIDAPKFVTGIEFHPGNARVVHHANIRLDRTAASRELDARDAAPGYDGLMARSAVYPDGHFLGWTPGQVAPLVPSDMAWRLEPGTDLVVQLHMQPSGAIETVRPEIGLFFGHQQPTRTPTILRLGSQGIDIAPGVSDYTVRDSYVLPVDVDLHAVQPHAHYRLRDVQGLATLPDGTVKPLIRIKNWDFRWQHVYRYTAPVPLPKGTRVSMQYVYDNSTNNPRNPQQPPQRVYWGQRSVDEMGDLWFQFVTRSDADRTELAAEVQRKMTAEDIIGYETMLRVNPRDAELHDDVALLYLAAGRPADAVRHFAASAELKPDTASAHFNVATALSVDGRLDEAIRAYRRALALRPDYASAHNNLGTVLVLRGEQVEAIRHFREAVRLDGANVQGQRNLAWHLALVSEANSPAAAEAVRAGEHAARLTNHQDPQALDALAAAYAAAGHFDRAVATAERAVTLARDELFRRAVRDRLTLYQQRRPYRPD